MLIFPLKLYCRKEELSYILGYLDGWLRRNGKKLKCKQNTKVVLSDLGHLELSLFLEKFRTKCRGKGDYMYFCQSANITINRIRIEHYEIIYNSDSGLSAEHLNIDNFERYFGFWKLYSDSRATLSTVDNVPNNNETNIALALTSPIESFLEENEIITPDVVAIANQQSKKLGNSNTAKPFSQLCEKRKKVKINMLHQFVHKENPNYGLNDIKLVAAALNDKLNGSGQKRRNKEVSNIQFQEEIVDCFAEQGVEIKKTRRTWKPEHKEYIIDLFEWVPAHLQIKVRQKLIDSLGGAFAGLKWSQVSEWIKTIDKEKQKTGPKVNIEFEQAVWNRLIIAVKKTLIDVENNKTIETVKVLYNVTYSYDIIISAAKKEQEQDIWHGDQKIQALKFSNGWVHGFLQRADFNRRRITRNKTACPAENIVQDTMSALQQILIDGGYEDYQVANLDETALNWGLGPTYIFCASDTDRGEQEITDVKARITKVPVVLANGKFLPLYFILKHSVSSETNPDQTTMRVIKQLHKEVGYKIEDGWELKTWIRLLDGVEHKCLYLIHRIEGHVITSQHKAWNDSVRMAMMIDLVLKPYVDRNGGKMLLWMDNCSLHKVWWLQPMFDAAGIQVAYLPPNMTWLLQVLDLVVNGPIKAHIRKLRAERILNYFEEFHDLFDEQKLLPEEDRIVPKWEVPKPDYKQCILDMIDLVKTQFSTTKFQEGVKKSFISTGCFHKTDKTFVIFKYSNNLGTLKFEPKGTVQEFPQDENRLSREEMIIVLQDQIFDNDFDENLK